MAAVGLALPWVRREAGAERALVAVFALGALGATLAAAAGWVLATREFVSGSEASLLETHRLAGTGVAGLAVLATLLLSAQARRGGLGSLGRILGLIAAIGASYAGFLGGEMVYGPGHLLEAGSPEKKPAALPELVSMEVSHSSAATASEGPILFQRDIQPILRRSCLKCHDATRHKGGLRLDRRDLVLAGGDSGPALVVGEPEQSELLRRVQLPRSDEDAMPGKGRLLNEQEVALLTRWIAEGASW